MPPDGGIGACQKMRKKENQFLPIKLGSDKNAFCARG